MTKFEAIKALGTLWWFEIFDDVAESKELQSSIVSSLQNFESSYSRFLDDSKISQLNRERNYINPDKEFLQILKKGVGLYNHTLGQFNFLLGGLLESRGYDRELSFHNDNSEMTIPAISDIEITPQKISLKNNAKVDLGGFGKGYAIKMISDQLISLGYKHHLINGGGDIFVTSNFGEPISIQLRDPLNLNNSFGSIQLKDEAMCASSILLRSWKDRKTKKIYSHIIDPERKDKLPSGSSFVVSQDPVLSDAMATVLSYKFDDEEFLQNIRKERAFEYLVITKNGLQRSPNFPILT